MAWVKGIIVTVQLTASALISGVCFSIILVCLLMSKNKLIRYIAETFIFIIKGTPMLVQIFLIYYGFGQLIFIKKTFLWYLFKKPFFCASLALSINSGSYMSIVIKNAILLIPKGQKKSAQALGLSNFYIYYKILIPQAIRTIFPVYFNESIILLKSTSLASGITLLDIMGVSNTLIAKSYNVSKNLIIAGVIYLGLNYILGSILSVIFKKYRNIK